MIRDGAVGFSSTTPFAPHEGMTIVVGFPKGIIASPGFLTRLGWFFSHNKGAGAGLAGLALMLGFLYWRWLLVGRDPAAGPKFPRYDAPKGLSAAAVRFIDRQQFDDRCFAAALLGLGSRGYLRIQPAPHRYRIHATRKKVDFLAGERPVAGLAANAGRTLGSTFAPSVQGAPAPLQGHLKTLYHAPILRPTPPPTPP